MKQQLITHDAATTSPCVEDESHFSLQFWSLNILNIPLVGFELNTTFTDYEMLGFLKSLSLRIRKKDQTADFKMYRRDFSLQDPSAKTQDKRQAIMQSKVLCLLFVTLVASSVTAGIVNPNNVGKAVGKAVEKVVKGDQNQTGTVSRISIPSVASQDLDVARAVEAAEKLLGTLLGGVGNLVEVLTNLVTAALKGVQPLADIINIITQILKAFSEVAAGNPLDVGVRILQNGLQLANNVLGATINMI
ncbi:hypothetical protein E2986_11152 [Frieseomelitta varia]|uniref:Uncharacterized protein n=2 Tax=Frieseomelitta varia TaxID=561572 RepID=A0A833SCF8_9HYME|nr:hypothetical protein E2986_11152 [Frieseomelitta varia]